jgi:predicted dehydrogenase
MIHDLDLVALLFAGAPTRIEARGRAVHGEAWDEVEAQIWFPAGQARLRASRIAETRTRRLAATYPSGVVEIDMLTHALHATAAFPLDPGFAAKAADPLGQALAAFLDAVIEGGASAIPGASGAAAVALAEAVDQACAR